ncbi:hypothetical protein ACPA9J_05495 [Pseudomonas aeruginosa]
MADNAFLAEQGRLRGSGGRPSWRWPFDFAGPGLELSGRRRGSAPANLPGAATAASAPLAEPAPGRWPSHVSGIPSTICTRPLGGTGLRPFRRWAWAPSFGRDQGGKALHGYHPRRSVKRRPVGPSPRPRSGINLIDTAWPTAAAEERLVVKPLQGLA